MNRRGFLTQFLLAVLFVACGQKVSSGQLISSKQATRASACDTENPNIEIGKNHGHSLSIPIGDVLLGTAKSYNVTTGHAHTHTFTLSASDMQTLKSNLTLITKTTRDFFHSHAVTITCVG